MPAAFSRGSKRRAMGDINMVPFIDVMLVLLIILMVTATAVAPSAINVPSAGAAGSRPPDQRIDVLIDDAGRISLAGEVQQQDISEERAVEAIRAALAEQPDMPVMIAADSELRYQQVISMMRQVREAGVQRVGLAVK